MIILIDNYDSFTWNLVHLIGGLNHHVEVHRNDKISVAEVLGASPDAIVLSPGPCTPDQAGICLDLVCAAAKTQTPTFGVCLGLQTIAQALGGQVVRAPTLMHGKVSNISITAPDSFMAGLPNPLIATRYHSLVADRKSLPKELMVCAKSDDDGEIMAVEHRHLPMAAVQFHPESIETQSGQDIFAQFMHWAQQRIKGS